MKYTKSFKIKQISLFINLEKKHTSKSDSSMLLQSINFPPLGTVSTKTLRAL